MGNTAFRKKLSGSLGKCNLRWARSFLDLDRDLGGDVSVRGFNACTDENRLRAVVPWNGAAWLLQSSSPVALGARVAVFFGGIALAVGLSAAN